jgi:hypothetical protein
VLLELAPRSVAVQDGAVTVPLEYEQPPDLATEATHVRALSHLVAHVAQLGAEGADSIRL